MALRNAKTANEQSPLEVRVCEKIGNWENAEISWSQINEYFVGWYMFQITIERVSACSRHTQQFYWVQNQGIEIGNTVQ